MAWSALDYLAYLRSPTWAELRAKALERDGYRCRVCATDQELEVHHRRYPDVLGTETVEDLTTLCRTCHHTATTDLRRRTYRLRRHDVTDTPRLTPGKVRMKVNVSELEISDSRRRAPSHAQWAARRPFEPFLQRDEKGERQTEQDRC